MTTITRAKETGRAGRDANSAMADLWRSAEMLDQNLLTDEQRARGEHWVPWRAIEIRHDILPRAQREPDQATVNEYVGIFEHLPAIEVQQDSLVLIDGLHRLSAAPKAGRDHIRVIEQDAEDDELWRLAFRANVGHGHRLTTAEKRAYAKRLLTTLPDAEEWSDVAVGRESGLHRTTIASLREEIHRLRSHSRKPTHNTDDNSESEADTSAPTEPTQGALPLSNGTAPVPSVAQQPPADKPKPTPAPVAPHISTAERGAIRRYQAVVESLGFLLRCDTPQSMAETVLTYRLHTGEIDWHECREWIGAFLMALEEGA